MSADYSFLINTAFLTPVFSPETLDDEQQSFRDSIRSFAKDQILPQRDQIEQLDLKCTLALLDDCAELGLCGVDIPESFGGLNMGCATTVITSQFLADCGCASFMVSMGAVTGIGLLPILLYGTEEQKTRWLPKVNSGELRGAYCLTEPGSGSDALSARSKAIRQGDEWVITGRKQYITNASFADYFIVFAQAEDPQHKKSPGFSAFFVSRESEGLQIGEEERKMGIKGSSTAPVVLENVHVPYNNMIGELGEGSAIALVTLDMGRLKLGMMDLGLGFYCITNCMTYISERKQFGTQIQNFGAIQAKLARMASRQLALECLAYRVVGEADSRMLRAGNGSQAEGRTAAAVLEGMALETSMVKIFGSETLARVTDECLQCYGGYGFIEDYDIAGRYRDARIDRIFEGSNEINRQVVTGNLLRAALGSGLPLRESLRKARPACPELPESLQAVGVAHQLCRQLFLEALNSAIGCWGQDLILRQQAAEDLADMCIQFSALDSFVMRWVQQHEALPDAQLFQLALRCFAADSLDEFQRLGARLASGMGPDGAALTKQLPELLRCRTQIDSYACSRKLAARMIDHGGIPQS